MINVFADRHLFNIEKYLSDYTNLTLFNPDTHTVEVPNGTDALLIRTVTKISAQSGPQLPESLAFVGTGSAGTDHVDREYLKRKNIGFASAAGCNARSVAEYVVVGILLWADEFKINVQEHTVGIIGVGHTGSAVEKILTRLDVSTVLYDPPREEKEANFESASLEQVLNTDILTFHTPLTHATKYPTYHWLDEEKCSGRNFSLIINASRGGVIDEQALLQAVNNKQVGQYILDVWENEPLFGDDIARHAFIKTPHIAGYSRQAKEGATRMIVQAMQNHFSKDFALPEVETPASSDEPVPDKFWSLTDALTYYHPVRDYETRFKMLVGRDDDNKAAGFNRIRTGQPLRDEFKALDIPKEMKEKWPALKELSL